MSSNLRNLRYPQAAEEFNHPRVAAQAITGGLVDEFQMIICPVVVGGGKRFFPNGVRLNLELVEERRFGNGVVALRYAVRRERAT